MGNEKKDEVVDFMEAALGLNNETVIPVVTEAVAEDVTPGAETPAPQTPSTTLVTQEQISINKELAKLDVQIETLEASVVDVNAFYENLETELSEEEQSLEFSDKSAYMKLVSKKAKEYEVTHSKQKEIAELTSQKQDLERVYERQSAITEVTAKYPDYNHEKVLAFYMQELSSNEQNAIISASKSYSDVYENAYKKYILTNPSNIHTETVPNIPNINNVRKQNVNNGSIANSLTSHDEQLRQALGL
ncbi:MAG: hypothetical protein WBK67_02425 [Minisyncoccales bacterium]